MKLPICVNCHMVAIGTDGRDLHESVDDECALCGERNDTGACDCKYGQWRMAIIKAERRKIDGRRTMTA